jgi:hypothetical protein
MSLMDMFIGSNIEERINNAYEKAKERRSNLDSSFHRVGFTRINGAWKLFEPSTGKEIVPDYSTGTFIYGDKIV